MSILITGAAGFIGSHLADQLLASGEEVVGLDNFDDFYDRSIKEANLELALSSPRFTLVEGDIRDAGTLADLPDGIEAIVHLAARAGVRPSIQDPDRYVDVNVRGTSQLLEFARKREIEALVFASSSSVYGNRSSGPFVESDPADRPISPYAATKRGGELLMHSHANLTRASCICLRLFTVYGPRQRPDLAIRRFSRLLLSGHPLPRFGDGSSARDYTHVNDTTRGIMAALERVRRGGTGFEILNLSRSETVSLTEMIETLGRSFGLQPEIDARPGQPGDVRLTWGDTTRARERIGYEPQIEFDEGMRRFAEWYLQAGAAQDGVSPSTGLAATSPVHRD